jgi:hypothetical protein
MMRNSNRFSHFAQRKGGRDYFRSAHPAQESTRQRKLERRIARDRAIVADT